MRHRAARRPGRRRLAVVGVVGVVLMLVGAATVVTTGSLVGAEPWTRAWGPAASGRPDPKAQPWVASRGAPSRSREHQAGRNVEQRWRRVLGVLDRRRARAYATADPALLRAVYTADSRVLVLDRRMLLRYRRLGVRVHGLRMRVLDLTVRAQRSGRVVLHVRERVAGGWLTGRGGRQPVARDRVDRRAITLRRGGPACECWRISAVRRL